MRVASALFTKLEVPLLVTFGAHVFFLHDRKSQRRHRLVESYVYNGHVMWDAGDPL